MFRPSTGAISLVCFGESFESLVRFNKFPPHNLTGEDLSVAMMLFFGVLCLLLSLASGRAVATAESPLDGRDLSQVHKVSFLHINDHHSHYIEQSLDLRGAQVPPGLSVRTNELRISYGECSSLVKRNNKCIDSFHRCTDIWTMNLTDMNMLHVVGCSHQAATLVLSLS